MAAENGQMEVCNILLKMKTDANVTDNVTFYSVFRSNSPLIPIPQHGQTPLHLAAENDHSDVVKLFLKHRPELVTMASTVMSLLLFSEC
jgi:ankyrin repeat protein